MDRTANYLNLMAIISLSGVITTACSDSFMKSSIRNKTSGLAALSTTIDEAGNITATIDPNATTTQIMRFDSGALAGSAIAIPPGALSIPVEITVGQGPTLSSADFLAEIGLTNNTVTAAGPSVSFIPSSNVEASNPFTLSLPLSITALALVGNNDNLVVMYHWSQVVNGEVTFVKGVIPGEEVVISNNKVTFQTTKFGTFQLARAEKPISSRVSAPTSEGTGTVANAKFPLLGDWGMCVAQQAYTEPSFLKPTWGFVQTGNQKVINPVHLSFRGETSKLEIKKYPGTSCNGQPQNVDSYGFVGVDNSLIATSSFRIFNVDNPTSFSSCLPVHLRPPPPPYIDINQVDRSRTSDGTEINTTVSRQYNETQITLSAYGSADCNSNFIKAITSTEATLTLSLTGPDSDETSMWVQVKDNASDLKSACVPVPAIKSSTTGISLNKFIHSSSGYNGIFWGAISGIYSYRLHGYNTQDCSGIVSKSKDAGTDTFIYFGDGDDESNLRSFKIEGTPPTSIPTTSSECHTILPYQNMPKFIPTGYEARSTWAQLRWDHVGVMKNDLMITQYDGLDCSSNPKALDMSSEVWWGEFNGSKSINNLERQKDYSFKLELESTPSISYCQNVSTTDADMPDWSHGNSFSVRNLPDDGLKVIAKTTVTNGKTDYKLKISINGMAPVERYSSNIPVGTVSEATLATIPKSEAENNIITAIAPDGCYFSSSPGKRDRAQSISTYSIASANEVICDGSMPDGGGGGGDSFGAPPNTVKSKQMRLGIISGGKVTFSEELFASENCALGTKLSQIIEDGSATFTSDAGTFPIDVSFNRKEGLIFTDSGVTAANKDPDQFGCGLKNWVLGAKQNLTESSCGNDKRTEYLRFKVSDDNQLLFTCDPNIMNDSVYGKTPEMRFPGCDTAKSPTFKRRGS